MQVILLERIRKLGQMGDVVTVKDGFARNFLLPYRKALQATPANREHFEHGKVELEARNLELKGEAETVAKKLDGTNFIVIRQASDAGQLFGSVTTRDVYLQIKDAGTLIERNQVVLEKPIKNLGIYTLTVILHPEVYCSVSVNVARSDEEAVRQARGENILIEEDEYVGETTVAVEEVFEDAERAREAAEELAEEDSEAGAETQSPKKAAKAADQGNAEPDDEKENAENTGDGGADEPS